MRMIEPFQYSDFQASNLRVYRDDDPLGILANHADAETMADDGESGLPVVGFMCEFCAYANDL